MPTPARKGIIHMYQLRNNTLNSFEESRETEVTSVNLYEDQLDSLRNKEVSMSRYIRKLLDNYEGERV